MMLHQVLSGKDFNRQYQGTKFVKLTNHRENHNGYQFQTGLNADSIPLNPQRGCQPGGIYFCEISKLILWLNYSLEVGTMVYVRSVTIPDDAQVYIEYNKFKADRMILSDRQQIVDLEEWEDQQYCLEAVRQNHRALNYVKQQTAELCLEAVKQNGYALFSIKEQTMEVCLEAVKQHGCVLRYVKNQTPELCLEAVKQNGFAIEYVKQQTAELCLEAVKQQGLSLKYVKELTPELCMEAVKKEGLSLKFVKEQTPELCLAAVKHNGHALQYVKQQTPEVCLTADKQNDRALQELWLEVDKIKSIL